MRRVWGLICSDIAYSHGPRTVPRGVGRQILFVGPRLPKMKSLAAILYRLSHALGRRWAMAGATIKFVNHALTGADIAHEAEFGPGLRMLHPVGVVVGPGARAGAYCTLHQGVTLGALPSGSPSLGDGVHLSPGVCIIGPWRIGDSTRIAPNAVVTRTFDRGHQTLAGVPARVITEEDGHTMSELRST